MLICPNQCLEKYTGLSVFAKSIIIFEKTNIPFDWQ